MPVLTAATNISIAGALALKLCRQYNPEHIFNTQGRHWKCKQQLCCLSAVRLQNKTIRISTESTANQVQNQQKYRAILLILNDWNGETNSLKRWAHMASHASDIRQWRSWSIACTFTGKKIWKYRAPPFAENIAQVVTMRMNNACFRENLNLALVYQYFLLKRNNHNFFPKKTVWVSTIKHRPVFLFQLFPVFQLSFLYFSLMMVSLHWKQVDLKKKFFLFFCF